MVFGISRSGVVTCSAELDASVFADDHIFIRDIEHRVVCRRKIFLYSFLTVCHFHCAELRGAVRKMQHGKSVHVGETVNAVFVVIEFTVDERIEFVAGADGSQGDLIKINRGHTVSVPDLRTVGDRTPFHIAFRIDNHCNGLARGKVGTR